MKTMPEIAYDQTWNRFKTTDCGSFVGAREDLEEIARRCNVHADLLAALEDAEFLLRKLSINPKEAGAMADSLKRSAADARAAIAKAGR